VVYIVFAIFILGGFLELVSHSGPWVWRIVAIIAAIAILLCVVDRMNKQKKDGD
jgi:hypothetical protein